MVVPPRVLSGDASVLGRPGVDPLTIALGLGDALGLAALGWVTAGPLAGSAGRWGLGGATVLALLALARAGGYRRPWPWNRRTLLPLAVRALPGLALAGVTLVAARLADGGPSPGPGRLGAALAAAVGGVVGLRFLLDRGRAAVRRRGLGIRPAIVVGDAARAAEVAARLRRHPWVGEHPVGRVGSVAGPGADAGAGLPVMGAPAGLAQVLAACPGAVVWLAPPHGADVSWLPPALTSPDGPAVTWRMLPSDFARVVAPGLHRLGRAERARLRQRLRRSLDLPTVDVAMVGSRGVPARYSGIERAVEEVGSRLVEAGGTVTVYCHRKYVTARGSHRGMRLRFRPAVRTRHLETWTHVALASLDAFWCETSIWHYHALGPATWAWLPRLLGRGVVVTVQGLDWQRAKWGRLARLYLQLGEWASARLPHRTIVVSEALAGHYRERYGIAPVYIPNGFTPIREAGPAEAAGHLRDLGLEPERYLLFVGRLVPEKGCHTLVEAFGRLRTSHQLVLAGAGVYESTYVQRLQQAAGRGGRVRFLGFVDPEPLAALYRHAALVVHPSQVEGLSVTVLEAVSHGCALVVSDIPENREAARGAAALVRVDDPDDLASVLQELLDDPTARAALRARARAAAGALPNWDQVTRATLEVYGEVAESGGTRGKGPRDG